MPVHDLPTDSLAFVLLVFMLGLKHGFDADHLGLKSKLVYAPEGTDGG